MVQRTADGKAIGLWGSVALTGIPKNCPLQVASIVKNLTTYGVSKTPKTANATEPVILVVTNASPSDLTDLPCQRIKLVGKRHIIAAFQHELTFANHVHQFDASQHTFGGLE